MKTITLCRIEKQIKQFLTEIDIDIIVLIMAIGGMIGLLWCILNYINWVS